MAIDNKQGINDNTINSNNPDTGDNKNNSVKLKNVDNSNSDNVNVTGNENVVTVEKTKKNFFKSLIEKIYREDLPNITFLIVYFSFLLLMFTVPKMPWWGVLILFLAPITFWFIIKLLELIKDWTQGK